ncbi:MAG: hypothetical protein M0Z69_04040 [Actinomycetota bacterium]|nr:hypothetical protein [Actinomycetota bacterium]
MTYYKATDAAGRSLGTARLADALHAGEAIARHAADAADRAAFLAVIERIRDEAARLGVYDREQELTVILLASGFMR